MNVNAYLLDCRLYCEDCAPAGAYPTNGESDRPEHCVECLRPLRNPLTSYTYVLDAIRKSLRAGRAARNIVHPCYRNTYYQGSRHCEIVRDWATQLQEYNLRGRERRLVELYLSRTED